MVFGTTRAAGQDLDRPHDDASWQVDATLVLWPEARVDVEPLVQKRRWNGAVFNRLRSPKDLLCKRLADAEGPHHASAGMTDRIVPHGQSSTDSHVSGARTAGASLKGVQPERIVTIRETPEPGQPHSVIEIPRFCATPR